MNPGGAVPGRPEPGPRGPGLLSSKEPSLDPGDQVLRRAALSFGGADHPADAASLGVFAAALVSIEGATVGGEVGVELLALGQQHLPEMFGLKAIRGLGRLVADVHHAR